MVGGGGEVAGVVAGIGLVGVLVSGSVGTAEGILFGTVVVGPWYGAPVGQNDGIVVVIGLFHGANVGGEMVIRVGSMVTGSRVSFHLAKEQ